jgi:hypothetical protein
VTESPTTIVAAPVKTARGESLQPDMAIASRAVGVRRKERITEFRQPRSTSLLRGRDWQVQHEELLVTPWTGSVGSLRE